MMDRLKKEIFDVLEQISKEHCGFPEVNWFLQESARHFSMENLQRSKPDVIVIGEDIPRELVRACSEEPWFILGGSLETTHWSDSLVPRDSDPVSRSALGWLINDEFDLAEDAIVIFALSSDNRRKLAGLLRRRGIRVACADMPPQFNSKSAQECWAFEMKRLAETVSKHTGIRLTARRLNACINERQQSQYYIREFKHIVSKVPGFMSPLLRDTILESAWYAADLKEWTFHLQCLNQQMINRSQQFVYQPDSRPRVLMVGSPVVFPNGKLPVLIESSGLYLADKVDSVSLQDDIPCTVTGSSLSRVLKHMAASHMPCDAAGAWTSNTGLQAAVRSRMQRMPVDGIVFHVLKGQIEYDFELPKIEQLAAESGVPVIRLETDYQKQDIEQLRIRLEAFSEMLRQRNLERIRMAQ